MKKVSTTNKSTSSKSTVAKKNEPKPQAIQVPVAKKKTSTKTVYEPVDSRSATGSYGRNKAAEEGVSLAMSCVPIVGDGKDILEAVKGRDLITNKKLSGTERVITVAAVALPIIPAAPARKAVTKVATEPKVVKAVKKGTKKLASSSSELVKKAKKALSKSGKKSSNVIEDATKKAKSSVASNGRKVSSQLEEVNKKAVQKGKENAKIGTKNSKQKQETVDLELKYKDGWTEAQKAEADAKMAALSKAKTVKTKTKRGGTSAASKYRSTYGKSAIPKGYDVDHTIDLQLGGEDDILNMNPLDKSVNRSLGVQIKNAIKDYPNGTEFDKFKMH